MAIIGNFTQTETGVLAGSIKTLTLNAKAKFVPVDKTGDKGPDYRVFAGVVECGAAWKKTNREGGEYLTVKLDDPTFPAPIFANLVEVEEGEGRVLIWSRRDE